MQKTAETEAESAVFLVQYLMKNKSYETKSLTNVIFVGSLFLLGVFFTVPDESLYSIMISSVTA